MPMLATAGGDIRLILPLTHFFPSRTHCRRRPDSISSSDTTIIINSSVMLTLIVPVQFDIGHQLLADAARAHQPEDR